MSVDYAVKTASLIGAGGGGGDAQMTVSRCYCRFVVDLLQENKENHKLVITIISLFDNR